MNPNEFAYQSKKQTNHLSDSSTHIERQREQDRERERERETARSGQVLGKCI